MPAAARLYKLALKQRETAVFGPCMGSGGTPPVPTPDITGLLQSLALLT